MKTLPLPLAGWLASACLLQLLSSVHAATTIDPVNQYAYGANIGWINWRGDADHGAVVGSSVCSGYIYSANVGWINLGTGTPTNGLQYQNRSASDFGVNTDAQGNLRGFAYGANIGWINFEANGAPKVDLATGNLSGYIYSANCGWISLSNAISFVQADTIPTGIVPPPIYDVVELASLGAPYTVPVAINNSGQIVGYSANESGYYQAAFWSSHSSGPVNLGDLGGNQGEALGINDSGQIVGQTWRADGQRRATFWTNSGSRPLDLGTFPGGVYSSASGINGTGHIAGSAHGNILDVGAYFDAAFWSDSSSSPLRLDRSFHNVFHANAISDGDLIVGDALDLDEGAAGRYHAAIWGAGCCATRLDDLGGTSGALGVNASGLIIGSAHGPEDYETFAVVWGLGGGPSVLNSLTPTFGHTSDSALGINASGQIVGSSHLGFPRYGIRAALWPSPADPPIDLNDVIPSNSGWVLQFANAINDSGEIVGYGTFGGVLSEQRAFALVPVARALRITSLVRSGNDLKFSFSSSIGRSYAVLGASDLVAGAWTILQSGIPGNGSTVQVTIPNAFLQSRQFFRIQAQ